MKSLIYFLLFFTSLHLYAEEFQIVLDPFQGISEKDIVSTSSSNVSRQFYAQECTLKKISGGYSESCVVETEESREEADVIGLDVDAQPDSESQDNVNVLEMLEVQSRYSKECMVSLYEDGFYEESCEPSEEEEDLIFSEEKENTQQEEIGWGDPFLVGIDREEIVVPGRVEKAIGGVGQIMGIFIPDGQEITKEKKNTSSQFFSAESEQDEHSRGMGSGFFVKDISGQPVLISNYHIMEFILLYLFRMEIPDQDWFSETSELQFYVEQGDQKFRITGIRDISRLMDLVVLEVEDYTGSTLNIANDYANEVPAYILGYPGGDFQKVKATNAFITSVFRISFMISHYIDNCWGLGGISGSPVLNIDGEVIGVASASSPNADCRHVEAIPLEGFNNINLMSSVKDHKDSIVDLIIEQESLFYDRRVSSNEESKGDLEWITSYGGEDDRSFLFYILRSLDEEYLLNIYQKVFNSRQELDEEEEKVYKFLVQSQMARAHGFDISKAAQFGSITANFSLGLDSYIDGNFDKAHQLFQTVIQSRMPLHLYQLSKVYYAEENLSQACRLLTYAEESVEALDDLYQKYECDGVLNEV